MARTAFAGRTIRLNGSLGRSKAGQELEGTANTALQRAANANAKFREFRKSAPGTVLTYGGGGAVLAGILDRKLPKLGDSVDPSAAAAAAAALYALQTGDLTAASLAVGLGSKTLYGVGEQVADWLPG